jgi:hypothetical protein
MDKQLTKKQLLILAGAALLLVAAAFCAYMALQPAPNADSGAVDAQQETPVEATQTDAYDASEGDATAQDQGATNASTMQDSQNAEGVTGGANAQVTPSATEAAGDDGGAAASAEAGATGSASGASAASASAASGASSGSTSEATAQEPQQNTSSEAKKTIQVYVEIDSSRAAAYGWPASMGAASVTLAQGATAYDALKALGVTIGGSSSYVSAIGGLAEKQCGAGSGWLYSVNGTLPNKSAGKYTLSSGDTVKWIYTLELGNDL